AVDHVADGGLVGVPLLAVAPVLGGDLEALEAGLLAQLEAGKLLFFANRQVELGEDDLVLDKLILEVVDLGVGAPPVGLAAEALDALDQHAPVPGAVEDGDPTAAWQVPPEAPEVRLGAFLFGRRRDRNAFVL